MNYSKKVDEKWQKKRWEESKLFKYDPNGEGKEAVCSWNVFISIWGKASFRTLV